MRDGRACTGRRACAVARVRGGWVRVRGGARGLARVQKGRLSENLRVANGAEATAAFQNDTIRKVIY